MVSCDLCGKGFHFNCHLEKHLSRKFPCFSHMKPNNGNTHLENETTPHLNKQGDDKFCKFCQKSHVKPKLHANTCNMKEDEIRCLEIKLKKDVHLTHNNSCRFCLSAFSRADKIKSHYKCCGKRKEYLVELKNQCTSKKREHHHTTNIYNNNNTTINNNNQTYVINWSNENFSHIKPNQLVDILKKCVLDGCPKRFFSEFPRLAHTGEHRNVSLTNVRGECVDVYEDGKYIKMDKDAVMEDAAKRMIYCLDDKLTENDELNDCYNRVLSAMVCMENVVSGINNKSRETIEALRMMGLKIETARKDILKEVTIGYRNV